MWNSSRTMMLAVAGFCLLLAAFAAGLHAQAAGSGPASQRPGRSDPAFSQPSIRPGIDYTVPAEDEIRAVLERIRDHFVRNTPCRSIDTATGQAITDLKTPTRTAGIDLRSAEFIDWTYSMGVVHSAMLYLTDVTGDPSYQAYTLRNFDFIFEHLPYFRQQATVFGAQSYGYRRLIEMRELDDCGAIGAALIRAYRRKPDPRYKEGIDLAATHILTRQMRLPDGTLVRPRPVATALWIDDAYMSIPFLAEMGRTTGETRYFDDAARQVIGMAARTFNPSKGLFDHSWFADMEPDARFYWGRADGWMMMAMAELLSVMPETHPDRARVLEIFRGGARGA